METVIFLSTSGLQLIQGEVKHNNIKVHYFQDYQFKEGTMLDGVIMDDRPIKEALEHVKEHYIDKTRLVIDSGQILVKCQQMPKVSAREMQKLVKDEFVDVVGQHEDLIYDYTVIADSIEGKEGQLVLCAALERSFIEPYIQLFKEESIELETIDILTNSIIKLTASMPLLSNQSYILSMINGQDVNHYMFIKGQYVITNRCRIFSDRGSVAFITEVSNSLTKLLQFARSNYKDDNITHIYFAGLDKFEEDLLFSTISSNLSMKTTRFECPNCTSDSNNDFLAHKFLAVGSLWRR